MTTTTDLPDLDGTAIHYGIPVVLLGDDGDTALMLGHPGRLRALAALNRHVRKDLGWVSLLHEIRAYYDVQEALDAMQERWAILATYCPNHPKCGGPDAAMDPCIDCKAIRDAGWWVDYDDSHTAATPGAFPVTLLEL